MKQLNNKTITNKHIISFIFLSLFLFMIALPVMQVQAQIIPDGEVIGGGLDGQNKKETGSYELSDFTQLMINVANWILGISGSLALLAFVVGGLMFLISAGSREKVDQAKKILSGAVIGLAIVFFSYVAINFILSTVFGMKKWNKGDPTITTPSTATTKP